MWHLAIFPPNGLDRSLHAPILVGLFLVTFFAEAFGWTYAGLVVPGYLAAVAAAAPLTCALITVEAVLTYLVVFTIGAGIPRMGAWSTAFGRERFFLFIVVGVLVRVAVEAWFVPYVVAKWSFSHSRELYSVGLVLVPLYANVFWNSGIRAAGPRLAVVAALTYAFVELVLVRHTNYSLSRLLVGNESGAAEFLASPKAQMILVLGALLGARGNVLYGWDYNGILVPGLLAVAWYQPTKLAATLAEALVVFGVSLAVTKMPPLSRVLIVGTRRMLVAFAVGFVLKMAVGFATARLLPRVQLVDYLGYGYLLPALLAVKMWNKAKIGVVLLPTLQVSLTAFLLGNGIGFALTAANAALAGPPPATASVEPSESAAYDLLLGDTAPDSRTGYTGWTSRDAVSALVHVAAEARATGDVSLAAIGAADRAGMALSRDAAGKWISVRPRAIDPDADIAAPRAAVRTGRSARLLVVARPPAPGSSLTLVAFRAAETLDAAAVVLLSRHAEMQRSDRAAAEALARGLDLERVVFVEEALGEPRLSLVGKIPAGLDVEALGRAFGKPVLLDWRAASVAPEADAWADAPRLELGAHAADAIAVAIMPAPDVETWTRPAHREIAERMLPLTTVGTEGYRAPTLEELRLLSTAVVPAMRTGGAEPTPWIRALASRLRYRFARTDEPKATILFEPEGPTRRGQPTFAVRNNRLASDVLVEVPAPRWEVGTYAGAVALSEALGASGVLIAGAMPHEPSGNGVADVRRGAGRRSFYQRLHEIWLETGGHAVSVQGIAPDRAADIHVVLSVGREIPERRLEPAWTSPLRGIFEDLGYGVQAFDGTARYAEFAGSGDPTMGFAQKFAEGRYAIVWLGAGVRSSLAAGKKAARITSTFGRAHAIPNGDAATEVLEMIACGAPGGRPCAVERASCDLERATRDWLRFAREGNPFDVEGAGTGTGCHVRLVRDEPTALVWALVAKPREGRLIPVGIPVDRVTAPLDDPARIRRAMWLRLSAIDVRVEGP